MKVTVDKPKMFMPVTFNVTVESLEELAVLWLRLYVSNDVIVQEATRERRGWLPDNINPNVTDALFDKVASAVAEIIED